jgi:hypothetical protein
MAKVTRASFSTTLQQRCGLAFFRPILERQDMTTVKYHDIGADENRSGMAVLCNGTCCTWARSTTRRN